MIVKSQFTAEAIKIAIAAIIPHLVKVPPRFCNLTWSGVLDSVSRASSNIPLLLLAPTAQTTAIPLPWATSVYERRNGSGLSLTFSSVATLFATYLYPS